MPMGVAVDSLRRRLYIADPEVGAVLAGTIFEHIFPSGHITVSELFPVVQEVAAHWVAVDSLGRLFYSDAGGGHIWSLSADAVSARLDGAEAAAPKAVYSVDAMDPVKSPQGLAADGFHMFWVNGEKGQGTLQRGLAEPVGLGSYRAEANQLADNLDEAFGVCLSSSRVFYTARSASIYSIRHGGGTPTIITDRLGEPRGCAFDGDGTIYVADAQAGQVYAFPSGVPSLGRFQLLEALEVPGAYGMAVFSSGAAVGARLMWPCFAAAAMVFSRSMAGHV